MTSTIRGGKTEKAKTRQDMRFWSEQLRFEEDQCRFWFRHRNSWTVEAGGYAKCRENFLKSRARVKYARRMLAKYTARYLSLYAS